MLSRMDDLKKQLADSSLFEASVIAEGLTPEDLQEVADYLLGRGEYLLRLAGYLEGFKKAGHVAGVKQQNTIGRAVRKLFGYSYPAKGDISF